MKMKFLACLAILAASASGASAGDMGHQMGDFSLTGYLDGEFSAVQGLNDPTDPTSDTGWKSSFGNQSEVVLWAQSDPAEKASFMSEIYYWQASNTITLQQAAVNWHLYSTDAYNMSARMGKFYVPFGIEERSIYSTTNMLVSRPYIQVWTDNGVELNGGGKMGESGMSMAWNLALTNGQTGSGLSPQNTDTDNNKSIGGRVSLVPMENYEVGGSFQLGKWDALGKENYTLFGAHGIAKPMEGVDVRAEWAMSKANAALAGADLKNMALYGQASYTMPLEGDNMESCGLTARFGWMDPNTDADNDEVMQLAVGANFSPAERVNFKVEFDLNKNSTPSGVDDPKDNAILAQAVVGW